MAFGFAFGVTYPFIGGRVDTDTVRVVPFGPHP